MRIFNLPQDAQFLNEAQTNDVAIFRGMEFEIDVDDYHQMYFVNREGLSRQHFDQVLELMQQHPRCGSEELTDFFSEYELGDQGLQAWNLGSQVAYIRFYADSDFIDGRKNFYALFNVDVWIDYFQNHEAQLLIL